MPDLERILAKIATKNALPADLIRLRDALTFAIGIKQNLTHYAQSSLLKELASQIDEQLATFAEQIDRTIVDDPPTDPKQGGIIKSGLHFELDQLRQVIDDSQNWMTKLEQQERARTGIPTLKVRFNKVFGFYIEISKSYLNKIPQNYLRKQTLVNGERFITHELKTHEEIILTHQEKSQKLEYQIFQELVSALVAQSKIFLQAAHAIAELDVIQSFAQVALYHNYCRPQLKTSGPLIIQEGRHPVVEQLLKAENFVPNPTFLDQDTQQLLLITGPNMAGKSVYIRQVALIVLLAQIGSYVPAKSAEIPLMDQIFVRSGAADSISDGLSTFMVEMVETAYILLHATPKSLIIMDEIGRGTSTYDGISLAWAIAEYLVTNAHVAAKTLFATHYHELQKLAEKYPQKVNNFQMAIEDQRFLYKLIPGASSHSHGLTVARLAGLPEPILQQAQQILHGLEQANLRQEPSSNSLSETVSSRAFSPLKAPIVAKKIPFHQQKILKKLKEIDINDLTPMQALVTLAAWQKDLKSEQ